MARLLDLLIPGWWSLTDQTDFYPEDLPAEWQLSYFANAFPAVLIPYETWSTGSRETLAAWRQDVHAAFRFYLEAVPGLASEGNRVARDEAVAKIQQAEQALNDQLAGWVLHERNLKSGIHECSVLTTQNVTLTGAHQTLIQKQTKNPPQPDTLGEELWTGRRRIGRLLSPPARCVGDLRAARDWLQQLSGDPCLVLLHEISSIQLHQWRQLVDLMGIESAGNATTEGCRRAE